MSKVSVEDVQVKGNAVDAHVKRQRFGTYMSKINVEDVQNQRQCCGCTGQRSAQ